MSDQSTVKENFIHSRFIFRFRCNPFQITTFDLMRTRSRRKYPPLPEQREGWTFLWPGTLRPCQRPLFIERGIVSFSRSQILPIKILRAVFFTSAFSRILALWSAENLEFSWKRWIFLNFSMKTFKKREITWIWNEPLPPSQKPVI